MNPVTPNEEAVEMALCRCRPSLRSIADAISNLAMQPGVECDSEQFCQDLVLLLKECRITEESLY